MTLLLLGGALLCWPLATLPRLLKNKRQTDQFFLKGTPLLISKSKNFGNSLNPQNKLGFVLNLVFGLLLILAGIWQQIHDK